MLPLLLAAARRSESVLAQTPPVVRGINGSWEAYPLRGDGFGSGVPPKTPVPAPAPIPEPPLTPAVPRRMARGAGTQRGAHADKGCRRSRPAWRASRRECPA